MSDLHPPEAAHRGAMWKVPVVGAATVGALAASLSLMGINPWDAGVVVGLLCVCVGSFYGLVSASFYGFGEYRSSYPQYLWVRLGGALLAFGFCLGWLGLMWRLRPLQAEVDTSWLRVSLGVASIIATPFSAGLLWGLLVDVPKSRAARSAQPA